MDSIGLISLVDTLTHSALLLMVACCYLTRLQVTAAPVLISERDLVDCFVRLNAPDSLPALVSGELVERQVSSSLDFISEKDLSE